MVKYFFKLVVPSCILFFGGINFGYASSAPVIISQPVNATVIAPAAATFKVVATGTPVPTYQWKQEAPGASTFTSISGATGASYTTPATSAANNGTQYECVVNNSIGSVISKAAKLTLTTPNILSASPIGTQPFSYNVVMTVTTNENMVCKYQQVSSPSPSGGINYSSQLYPYSSMPNTFSSTGGTIHTQYLDAIMTLGTYQYYHVKCQDQAGNQTSTDEIVSFVVLPPQAPTTPVLSETLSANGKNNVLSWTTASAGAGIPVAYNVYRSQRVTSSLNTAYSKVVSAAMSTTWTDTSVIAGRTYFYYVTAFVTLPTTPTSNASNIVSFPTIILQPSNITVTVSQTATFTISATGIPAPTYQWEQEVPGANSFTAISGAISSSYSTTATTMGNSGTKYECIVTNKLGTVISNAATLTVNAPSLPTVSVSTNSIAYLAPAIVTLTATASETGGTISRVDFYNGSSLIGSSYSSPYTFSWSFVGAGNYTITAQAYDSQNVEKTSSAISINVIQANGSDQYSYDNNGQLTAATDPLGNITTYAYDANGDMTQVTLPGGRVTSYGYDALGHRTSVTDGLGNSTTYAYDAEGQVISVTDPMGLVTKYAYTPDGKINTITLPDSKTINYAYDGMNNLLSVTDQNGKVLKHSYDTTDALQLGKSLLTAVIDPKANPATTYAYDALDRLTTETDPAGAVKSLAYDAQGYVTTRLDAMSQQTIYSYDPVHRLSQINYGILVTNFTRDSMGRITALNDASGTTQYTYDKQNHVLSTTYPDTRVLQNTYDADERLTQVAYPSGLTVGYSYNANGDLSAISKNGSVLVQYAYDAAGRVITKSLMTNPVVQTSYTYDKDSRLTSLTTTRMSTPSVQLASYAYTYDVDGNVISLTSPSAAYSYQYDPTHQLTSVSGSMTHAYAYDAAGNRSAVDGAAYNTNILNQYTLAAGKSFYTYNNNGDLTADGTFSYGYDLDDRLTTVTGNGVNATYNYDGIGRRYSKTVNGNTVNFVYNGKQIIEEKALVTTTAQYIYGSGIDEILWSNTNGNSYYYLTDGLGSVRQIVNASGQVLQAYDYDAFGTPTVTNPSIQSRFGYTGREYDAETGLYQYRAREYSPTLGRYLQRDPIGFTDDYNLYRYVKNNPLNSVDSSGLEVESSIYGTNFNPLGADSAFGLGLSGASGSWDETSTAAEEALQSDDIVSFGLGAIAAGGVVGSSAVYSAFSDAQQLANVSFWQYYPAGNSEYVSSYVTPGTSSNPPYGLGEEASEMLSLPDYNPGTAVRQVNVDPSNLDGPYTVAPANGHQGGGIEYIIKQ